MDDRQADRPLLTLGLGRNAESKGREGETCGGERDHIIRLARPSCAVIFRGDFGPRREIGPGRHRALHCAPVTRRSSGSLCARPLMSQRDVPSGGRKSFWDIVARDLICAGNGRALNPHLAAGTKPDSNMQKKLPRLRQCKRNKKQKTKKKREAITKRERE